MLLSKERKFKSFVPQRKYCRHYINIFPLCLPTPVGTCTINISRSNTDCSHKINDQVCRKVNLRLPKETQNETVTNQNLFNLYDITWLLVWSDCNVYINWTLTPKTKPEIFKVLKTLPHAFTRFVSLPATFSLHLSHPTPALKLSSGVQLQRRSLNSPDSASSASLSILMASLKWNENICHSIYHITLKYTCDIHFSQETTILRNKNQFICFYVLRA